MDPGYHVKNLGSLLESGLLGRGVLWSVMWLRRFFLLCRLDGVEVEEDTGAYGIRCEVLGSPKH